MRQPRKGAYRQHLYSRASLLSKNKKQITYRYMTNEKAIQLIQEKSKRGERTEKPAIARRASDERDATF